MTGNDKKVKENEKKRKEDDKKLKGMKRKGQTNGKNRKGTKGN